MEKNRLPVSDGTGMRFVAASKGCNYKIVILYQFIISLLQSVTNRDYSMLLGVTVFYCTMLITFNFLVDILYVVIDPRIKLENAEV